MVNLLNTLRQNIKMLSGEPLRIFELGRIFLTRTDEEVQERIAEIEREMESYPRMKTWGPAPGEERLPLELRRLTALMTGPRHPRTRYNPDTESQASQLDFFDAKGIVEELLQRLHITGVEWLPVNAPLYHPGRIALVRAGGTDLGVVGELHPQVVEEWEIPAARVCAFDLDVEALVQISVETQYRYELISPYQPARQDMAFVIDASVPASILAGSIRRAGGAAVIDVTLFDIYTGPPITEGQRSLAFAVTFSTLDKPLTEDEIARLRARIERTVERELGAKLRT
jgi:phenylalanyl-tRNA synthetase beta chain